MPDPSVTAPDPAVTPAALEPAQAPQTSPAAPKAPDPNSDWETRFKGAMQSIERLTLENKSLQTQLTTLTSDKERLVGTLDLKDLEKTVAISERDKQLEATLRTSAEQAAELERLRALALKVNVANELGRPDLLKIADHLPNFSDPELMKKAMQDFAGWSSGLVQEREKQLMAGVTPAIPVDVHMLAGPSSAEGWEAKINGLPLGSKERGQAMADYYAWGKENASQH